jgi:hypothetical protein
MGRVVTYVRRHHVALLALFVAIGGTTYAAANLPRGSVGTRQLRRNSVVSSKVKDGSLEGSDFEKGALPQGARGATGPAGQQGATGPRGATGPTSAAPGVQAYAYVKSTGNNPSLDADRTRGFSSVSMPSLGHYCLTPAAGVDLAHSAIAVTPVWSNAAISRAFAQLTDISVCPAGTLQVDTYLANNTSNPSYDQINDFTVVVP